MDFNQNKLTKTDNMLEIPIMKKKSICKLISGLIMLIYY